MNDMPLFNAPAEPQGPYRVPGLRAHGDEHRGKWLVVWAEAPRPLYSLQDREAVMRERGIDPAGFEIHPPRLFNRLADKHTRTWWYCWPKGEPNPVAE
jgi:hypothetical protein